MILSKDLRIGNNLLKDGEIVEVAVINPDNTIRIWSKNKQTTLGCFKLNQFEPIPITKEILLRLGAEIENDEMDCTFYDKETDFYVFFEIDENKLVYTGGEGLKFSRWFKYVHELQNFVFELKRIELTFKD